MSSVIVRWMPDPTESIRLTWKTISPFFFLKRHLYFFVENGVLPNAVFFQHAGAFFSTTC